ncbi:MAG: helix-turn-helix transcriptional regulator [Boseongicola sp.]|nr:helix-turn-helix transcriptional regulator [Boseongicola sp.]MDD9978298.1 helix-turn-helix transcriptional regulator [Boseongicola sp.]
MNHRYFLYLVLAFQAFSAFFFVFDILAPVLGLPFATLNWTFHEIVEIAAAVGLITGFVFGGLALKRARERSAAAEEALRIAQSAFGDVLRERFKRWDLTPAEADVAMFAIKGFSIPDIANLRGVSEGTIKAQTAAIYRKAGVSGRPQLLSLFIDDLIENEND